MNSINHKKLGSVLLVIVLSLSISCEKTEDPTYLDQWLGMYEGSAYSWSKEWDSSNDSSILRESFWTVLAEVQKGEIDSSLSITLVFEGLTNDRIRTTTHSDLLISDLGYHKSSSGGGSSYSHVIIQFDADSLHYSSFSHSGIASQGGTDFGIAKKQ